MINIYQFITEYVNLPYFCCFLSRTCLVFFPKLMDVFYDFTINRQYMTLKYIFTYYNERRNFRSFRQVNMRPKTDIIISFRKISKI